jgi:uncharacterized phage protein gp47/JayE
VSGSTSVPAPIFTATGFVAPAESAILAGAQADINSAFGGTLNPALTTPQGQLATSESAILGDVNSTFLALANGVDPAYATGRMQDAIGRVVPGNGFSRIAATPTVLSVNCVGLVGVAIPYGALIQDNAGNLYSCAQSGTIPSTGTVTLPFTCQVTGPIACPAQTLTIYQTVPGWDAAATTSAGVPGTLVESRAAFETRRSASVASNAVGTLAAIRGAVLGVSGVLDCYVVDNPTASPAVIGGVTIPAWSLYVAAIGGTPAAIAQAIWTKKPPGCAYYGNTPVTVYDNGYATPQPYSVTYQTPTLTPIGVSVVLKNSTLVPSTALASIQPAIVAAFAGTLTIPRATIGSTIFASWYYGVVAALGAWAQIVDIQIGTFGAATFTGSITGATLTVSGVTGTIAIGQIVTGCTTPTIITGGSGTTWTVATLQTSSSAAMTAATPVNSVAMTIAQMPTLAAANIVLTLQ